MKIAIIDGQGGGIGKAIIEKIKKKLKNEDINIIALGTNALATASMLKAGADEGATGENAIVFNSKKVDIIIGTVAILSANSIMGEVSPKIAEAVGTSDAKKILLPLNRCNLEIIGVDNSNVLPVLIDLLVNRLFDIYNNIL
jgi:hypothetical protein